MFTFALEFRLGAFASRFSVFNYAGVTEDTKSINWADASIFLSCAHYKTTKYLCAGVCLSYVSAPPVFFLPLSPLSGDFEDHKTTQYNGRIQLLSLLVIQYHPWSQDFHPKIQSSFLPQTKDSEMCLFLRRRVLMY